MALPDEKTLAREFETEWNLEAGDLTVVKHPLKGQRCVTVFRRVVSEIDCYNNALWLHDAKECLSARKPFDLVNVTPADAAKFEPIAAPYSGVFRSSDSSARGRRRAFRLVSTKAA